jgi:hypothetical protein
MNATKTEYMTMEGGKRVVRLSNEAYERQCTGRGKTHRQKSLEKVTCEFCGTKVNRQHIPVHQKRDTCKNGRKEYVPPPPEWIVAAQAEPPERGTRTYRMSIPKGHTGEVVCPVDGCFASMLQKKRTSLRKHFRLRHLEDTIIIKEEGPLPLPRCNLCGFFSKTASTPKHKKGSAECRNFAEKRHRKFQQMWQEIAREVSFNVNGEKLTRFRSSSILEGS